jgi:hypothetical protein
MKPSADSSALVTEKAIRPDHLAEATFDRHHRYRYRLSRHWEKRAPVVCWIMLNPSTATASVDDRTISRVVAFSAAWRYGAAIVINLFALRATDPAVLSAAQDPVGPANDDAIVATVSSTPHVIAAWGNHGTLANPSTGVPRCEEVELLLESAGVHPKSLRMTGQGQPAHPLYLPASATPEPFGQSASPSPARIS